jgi:deoxyribodipyrimidine photo-lyase
MHDQPALQQAVNYALEHRVWLLPIYIADADEDTHNAWDFIRVGSRRKAWMAMAVQGLSDQLAHLGSQLLALKGQPVEILAALSQSLQQPLLVCEDICAPYEALQIQNLQERGVRVQTVWQSTLMAPESLPFAPEEVPDTFTRFRQVLEKNQIQPTPPLPPVPQMPSLPPSSVLAPCLSHLQTWSDVSVMLSPAQDARTSFPMALPACHGAERAALAHVADYCRRGLPSTYKTTRNQLMGMDYSTKWSPWLATGALSSRQAWSAVAAFEQTQGANESTYWICFELLWRDHFRWLHRKHGVRLYRPQGLTDLPAPLHHPRAFQQWCQGETGQPFIDAAMRELALTGYLSNRMRQNAASYLIHDLQCDWRAGAAWFESQLIDFDVYSNQGNWLYLAGRGTDPRGSRRFNPEKQASDYDPSGEYRQSWASSLFM